jgi:ribosomal protein S18 acetylase RimI-like enzyme
VSSEHDASVDLETSGPRPEITALIRGSDGAHREWRRGSSSISTDKRKLDVATIHDYLSRSYWAEGIPRSVVETSIENSLCFGLYEPENAAPSTARTDRAKQIGFARLVTDGATFAYLADVFVLEEFRGRGLSKWLMQTIMTLPELAGLRRWNLATRDAHGLYRQFGFVPLAAPERYMERLDPDVYKRANSR